MLSEFVKSKQNLTLQESNKICMEFARILVSEKFDMKNLADLQERILELVDERFAELKVDLATLNSLYYVAMVSEISLYIGMEIAREYYQKSK